MTKKKRKEWVNDYGIVKKYDIINKYDDIIHAI